MLLLAALACAPHRPLPAAPTGEVVILAINDTYRIEGDRDTQRGGMDRVAALRQQLHTPDALVLHAGDVLGPSFVGRSFAGHQMIDVLNVLDGDPQAFDPYLFVTLGNHEIDEVKSPAVLDADIEASAFTWLGANLRIQKNADGSDPVAASN
jgi:2',3'-cyclic-nucleotide 2'-phosphodiesterase (5'-nucleotidase family)